MASIQAAGKLANYDGGKWVPATMSALADAIRWADKIMSEIDRSLADSVVLLGVPNASGMVSTTMASNVAYVIPDSGFQLGQNRIQFALILGGNSPISE